MKTIRRIGLFTVLALSLAVMLWMDNNRDEGGPRIAPPKGPVAGQPEVVPAAPPIVAGEPKVAPVRVREPAARSAATALEKSESLNKDLSPLQELVPAAAVGSDAGNAAATGAQESKAAEEKPDSVFAWGPWSGGQPDATPGAPTPPQDGTPRVPGFTQAVSATTPRDSGDAGSTPAPGGAPGATLPPVIGGSIKGGYGYGDTNHVHIHRRDR